MWYEDAEISSDDSDNVDLDEGYNGFAFLQGDSNKGTPAIPKSLILNQSTINLFSNPRLLTNIRKSKNILRL